VSGWGQAHTFCCWCPPTPTRGKNTARPRRRPSTPFSVDLCAGRGGCLGVVAHTRARNTYTHARAHTHARTHRTRAQRTRAQRTQRTHTQRTPRARTHSRALTHTYKHACTRTLEGGRHQPPTHQGARRSQSCATRQCKVYTGSSLRSSFSPDSVARVRPWRRALVPLGLVAGRLRLNADRRPCAGSRLSCPCTRSTMRRWVV